MTLQEFIMNYLDVLLGIGAILTFVGVVYNLISSSKQTKMTDTLVSTSKDILSGEHKGLSGEHKSLSMEHSNLSEKLNDIKSMTNTVYAETLKRTGRNEALSKVELNIKDTVEHISAIVTELHNIKLENQKLIQENKELLLYIKQYENNRHQYKSYKNDLGR